MVGLIELEGCQMSRRRSTENKKIHPPATDGFLQLTDKNTYSIPTGTQDILAQNVSKYNRDDRLEYDLKEAARLFQFPESMNVKEVLYYLISRGVYTSDEIEAIGRCLSNIKYRLYGAVRRFLL